MKTLTRALFSAILLTSLAAAAEEKPNVLIIIADDLGYADTGCYGATKVLTPNVDRLAREGLRFTDGYATSSTCTPSRYALLTGQYPWRKRGTGVLPGDAALIIEPGRATLPAMMKKAGYTTGAVGKWHLGLGSGGLDWNGPIKPGPREIGFDYNFIMAATGDRVPCVYVENDRIPGLDPKDPILVDYDKPIPGEPTGQSNPELLRMHPSHGHDMAIVNGVSRIGYMKGGKSALWNDEEMADEYVRRGAAFIEKNKAGPFFLYFASHDVHVPRLPHPRFLGKSGMGPRGDAILSFDWSVGEILATLDKLGLTEKTLVILTSDNGAVIDDGYKDDAVEKLGQHKPSGPLKGGKYTVTEGGTRVPFIVRWPGRVKPGVSHAIVNQIDFLASLAAMTGQKVDATSATDTQNVLPALLGESEKGREYNVNHSGGLAIRKGDWKLISGGGAGKRAGGAAEPQLFNLATDVGETTNLAKEHPEKIIELRELLEQVKAAGPVALGPPAAGKAEKKAE